MRTSLHSVLREAADAHAHRPAVTYKDTTVTYADLWSASQAAGALLVGAGLRPGERCAVFMEKRIETVTAMLGTSVAAGVFVPVNPVLRATQVAHILADCDVRVLVTTPERLAMLRDQLSECPALVLVLLVGGTGDDGLPEAGEGWSVAWWEPSVAEDGPIPAEPIDLDVAAILYTSGSTGKPKGVVLSHRNLVVGAESVSTYLENTCDDVILSALPLSFDAGLSQLTTAMAVGAHLVLMNYLLPREVVRLCERHQVTGLTCVPPLWIQIADLEWPPAVAATMRYFANTGGKMPRATLDRLRTVLPAASPYLMYGLTESFRSTYLDPAEVDRRPDSIGKAIPDAEVLVVRPDGSRCDPGEEGELVHRGALVALGYWGDSERTAERFKPAPGSQGSPWRAPEIAVWSGDRVVADDEGFLYFVGRQDDMIKTSGYRVSPTEVEEVAYASGLVRDAVALGLPDPALGQRIVLVVAPSGAGFDAAALLAGMRKELPLFMVPAEVQVRPEIPRSPNGKFDRTLIRAELTESVEAVS